MKLIEKCPSSSDLNLKNETRLSYMIDNTKDRSNTLVLYSNFTPQDEADSVFTQLKRVV